MPAGNLYLVPVPIGNLRDITLRALEILQKVEIIAAEDTRITRSLLSHYQIKSGRLISLHKYNEKKRIPEILELLEQGKDIAVVSDAGSPGISDPASLLVQEAIDHQINIIPLPGATAIIPALTASGFNTESFLFLGFLPLTAKHRKEKLSLIKNSIHTVILYEAPHRIKRTLTELSEYIDNRRICLAREITKIYEEFIRGNIQDIITNFNIKEKGEFVIVIEGNKRSEQIDRTEINQYIEELLGQGLSSKTIAQMVANRFRISANSAYSMVLKLKGGNL
ncbi:MAG TPA: 16S rRNA (cytidine(1402)-2'-O)-methyltransferase [Candidatus Syntrophosphaera thermopropionivorans]|nr:16S rRNA (cytidine(1402)-2'-O)-methyltransferase [Candidatus Syntrophosphaera sp.]HPW25190.1 16S rRNA (cytidine(1402)-2'-O)-methyltransferase [Candidatus Syntrophosphaera thermopropionivorans]HPX62882.1 16S rRNA (cytidine(1402)-2'-O)-methyltransferase [Candidatus Syntrophosphaera thermopropionivorans]